MSVTMGREEEGGYLFHRYELEEMFDTYQGRDWIDPPSDSDSSSDGYSDGDLDMTDEQRAIHDKQVQESDGFDVKLIPGICDFGVIEPFDLSIKKELDEVEFFAKMAIEEFNKRLKVSEGELVFDKVLMATSQAVNGIRYYITFDAKNLAQGGKSITYQAVVAGIFESKVESFRLKPKSGLEKKWFWVDHLCDCSRRIDV